MCVRSSLKRWKISLYLALGYKSEYVVEAGAHAGSTIERMSVKGMTDDVAALQPSGLATALRYARGVSGAAAAELDHLAFQAMRQWLAELGWDAIPRANTWSALKLWATQRATVASTSQGPTALCPMRPSAPEPELGEQDETIASYQDAHTGDH